MTAYPDCSTCKGYGTVQVDWGEDQCPSCRLRSRDDRIREAAEDHIEAAYKDQYGPDYRGLAVYGVEGR